MYCNVSDGALLYSTVHHNARMTGLRPRRWSTYSALSNSRLTRMKERERRGREPLGARELRTQCNLNVMIALRRSFESFARATEDVSSRSTRVGSQRIRKRAALRSKGWLNLQVVQHLYGRVEHSQSWDFITCISCLGDPGARVRIQDQLIGRSNLKRSHWNAASRTLELVTNDHNGAAHAIAGHSA